MMSEFLKERLEDQIDDVTDVKHESKMDLLLFLSLVIYLFNFKEYV